MKQNCNSKRDRCAGNRPRGLDTETRRPLKDGGGPGGGASGWAGQDGPPALGEVRERGLGNGRERQQDKGMEAGTRLSDVWDN